MNNFVVITIDHDTMRVKTTEFYGLDDDARGIAIANSIAAHSSLLAGGDLESFIRKLSD